jgi:hypothetical protein
MTEKINFNLRDDIENINILENKLIERVKRICNIDKLVYVELKNKLIELAENATTETKLKFLLYLCDTGLNLEDVAELLPVLYTHCITHLFIKKLLFELIELRNDINKDEDMTKICEELKINGFNVYMDIINDDKKPAPPPPPPKPKPKRKPKPKQPEPQTEPQTETETEQQKQPFKPKRKPRASPAGFKNPRTKQPQTEQAKEEKKQDKEQKKELYKKLELIFN